MPTTHTNMAIPPARKRPVRRRVRGAPLRDLIAVDLANGMTWMQMATKHQVDKSTIRRHIKEIKQGNYGSTQLISPSATETTKDPRILRMLENHPEAFFGFNDEFWPNQKIPDHAKDFIRAAFKYAGTCNCGKPAAWMRNSTLLCDEDAHEGDVLKDGCVLVGKWKESVVINVPRNHAKTTYYTIRWAVWRLCQNRDWRLVLVSATENIAKQFVGAIALVLDANEGLLKYFPAFHTESAECRWQIGTGALAVAGNHLSTGFNVLARGVGTQIHGLRADEIVCDDIIDSTSVLTQDRREKTSEWYHQVVLPVLDPGGLMRIVGTRFHIRDIYRELADMTDHQSEEPVYEHINFAALSDPEGNPSLDPDFAIALWECKDEHKHYPTCCRSKEWLLRSLLPKLGTAAFEMTMQQVPPEEGSLIADPQWIYGREDDPSLNKGCLDRERNGLDPSPPGQDMVRIVSIDPSPSMYAGIVVADVTRDRSQFKCVVKEVVRKRMGMRDVMLELERIFPYYEPRFIIIELNAAQRVYLEDIQFMRLCKQYRVSVKKHFTGINKNDTQMGYGSLSREFEFGNIRLPYGDVEARGQTTFLLNELFGKVDTDDVLMALWFIKVNHASLPVPQKTKGTGKGWGVPSWARSTRSQFGF